MPSRTSDNSPNGKHQLHALCPYFAMFPYSFARESILATTKPGDLVLDPFCGRGTTVLEALLNDRDVIACDTNPVAAIVSQAKANPPKLYNIQSRIDHFQYRFRRASQKDLLIQLKKLPEFFKYGFARETLLQILYLKKNLLWRTSRRDRFICALLLGHLHGETDRSSSFLSNHMAHSIAQHPDYLVRYWREHQMVAPKRNVFKLLREKAAFRLKDGTPAKIGRVVCDDARKALKHFWSKRGMVSAVITSPPYLDVTSYEEAQWLRIWFLGGKTYPTYNEISKDDRHRNADSYFTFLFEAWQGISPLLRSNAIIICRLGTKAISRRELSRRFGKTICTVWPKAKLIKRSRATDIKNRQTNIFRPGAEGCRQEYDYFYNLG